MRSRDTNSCHLCEPARRTLHQGWSALVAQGASTRTATRLADAGRAVQAVMSGPVRSCGLDRRSAALLIVQIDPDTEDAAGVVSMSEGCGVNMALASDDTLESKLVIATRRAVGEAVMARGPSIIEDGCVPVPRLVEFLTSTAEITTTSGVIVATVGTPVEPG